MSTETITDKKIELKEKVVKEHNLMMGHNAPTESTSIIKVEKSLADRLTNASKR